MTATERPAAPQGVARRWTYAVLAVAFLFVLMPFLFWQSTWFGKPLTEEATARHLADREHPRKTQHALSQIADRILRGDASVKRWYPQVVALAAHPADEIRITAAWVMGQDNQAREFRAPLLEFLRDAHPMVRRNAALSLVRFSDASGRKELVAMLEPYTVASPRAGVLVQRLKLEDTVNPGTLLARIRVGETEHEVRSQVPGRVERWLAEDSAAVEEGQGIVLLAPSQEMVWEALRALFLVGQPEDLPAVERYTRPRDSMPPQIQQQALATARAIRERAESEKRK